MKKPMLETPRWIVNLRALMEAQKLNPRSLSLKAGLNATAVRDMLEGRTRFPRYDTALALSQALNVTPSQLMGGPTDKNEQKMTGRMAHVAQEDNLELLTEIIARLQEVAEEYQHKVEPRDFAAMVTTIYKRLRHPNGKKPISPASLHPQIYDLMAYDALRRAARK